MRQWPKRCAWVASVLFALLGLCCFPALATDRALLIGVADYPELPRRLWLRGPINDVALMRQVLLARGMQPEHQRVLVSRAGGADEPTRAHILQAMQAMLVAVKPGDRVVLHLAGHGAQQPQPVQHGMRPTEADGMDEVFLPADARQWDGMGNNAAIPNALLDDEIGEWMDALVDAGATVFAVFDTCHAAGIARAGSGQRWRAVSAGDLRLPPVRRSAETGKAKPPDSSGGTARMGRTDGRSLAFAARGHEATSEEWLPRGARFGGNKVHGVFTYHLAAALMDGGPASAAGLQRRIRAAYGKEQRVSPTPLFTGTVDADWP